MAEDKKVVGYWTLSNYGGLSVIEPETEFDDALTVRWYDDEQTETCEIIYEVNEDSGELEACINFRGTLYFLSNCMRVR